jgi:glyoxylase-like metal-dependent hydrolase (beta-lactamase superfamily II)
MADTVLDNAIDAVEQALRDAHLSPGVETFFDEATNAATHVVWDRASAAAAVIDSVLDYDPAAGRISTASADAALAFLQREGLRVDWLIETHAHADHLGARGSGEAPWRKLHFQFIHFHGLRRQDVSPSGVPR